MSKPVLHYFNFKGRAEAIRLAFFIGGIDFEDKRIETLDNVRDSYPFGQVPVLEVDGKQLSQSLAIVVYAGKRAKLLPEDDWNLSKVLEMSQAIGDLVNMIVPSLIEPDNEKKMKMRHVLATEKLPSYFAKLNKLISKNGHAGYSVGDKLTVADLQLYNIVDWMQSGVLDGIPKTIADKYDDLMKVFRNVDDHPKVKEWNAIIR